MRSLLFEAHCVCLRGSKSAACSFSQFGLLRQFCRIRPFFTPIVWIHKFISQQPGSPSMCSNLHFLILNVSLLHVRITHISTLTVVQSWRISSTCYPEDNNRHCSKIFIPEIRIHQQIPRIFNYVGPSNDSISHFEDSWKWVSGGYSDELKKNYRPLILSKLRWNMGDVFSFFLFILRVAV